MRPFPSLHTDIHIARKETVNFHLDAPRLGPSVEDEVDKVADITALFHVIMKLYDKALEVSQENHK